MEEQSMPVFKNYVLVFLYAIYLICALLVFGCKNLVDFAFGYYFGNMIYYIMIFGLLFLLFIILSIVIILEFESSWRKNRSKDGTKKGLVVRGCFLLFVVLCIPVGLFVSDLNSQHVGGLEKFHKGFYIRVKENINFDGIREWLNGLDEETFEKWSHNFHPEITDSINIPKDVFAFRPSISYITLFKDDSGSRCIDLEWGGPFGRWGVVVGTKDIKTPLSDTERYGRYCYTFEEGVYSWQQIR